MLWNQYKGKPHDCSDLSQSLSLCISQLQEVDAETHRQHKAQQHSAHFTGRESSGAAQTPGTSAHALPSEDEKRRLHYQL